MQACCRPRAGGLGFADAGVITPAGGFRGVHQYLSRLFEWGVERGGFGFFSFFVLGALGELQFN